MFLVQAQQESGRIREAASLVGAVNLKSTRRYAQSLTLRYRQSTIV
jgi:hypothetical protein